VRLHHEVLAHWDNAGAKWVNTTVPCVRPQAYKWQHLVLEGQRISGKTVFISFTLMA